MSFTEGNMNIQDQIENIDQSNLETIEKKFLPKITNLAFKKNIEEKIKKEKKDVNHYANTASYLVDEVFTKIGFQDTVEFINKNSFKTLEEAKPTIDFIIKEIEETEELEAMNYKLKLDTIQTNANVGLLIEQALNKALKGDGIKVTLAGCGALEDFLYESLTNEKLDNDKKIELAEELPKILSQFNIKNDGDIGKVIKYLKQEE